MTGECDILTGVIPLELRNYADLLAKHIYEQQKAQQFSDVILVVDGHNIHVHRLILTCFSGYFTRLFTKGMVNKDAS